LGHKPSVSTPKRGIKAFDSTGIEHLAIGAGYEKYRAGQLIKWLYGRGARSYSEMRDLPGPLREYLAINAPLDNAQIVAAETSSTDGTRKYLLEFSDKTQVECAGLLEGERLTVCISSQAGCPVGCTFCATGHGGFVRNLTPGEMVDQVRLIHDDLGRRVTNVVAMGQGEPFFNYDYTMAALEFINSALGLGIGARRITVSTCGVLTGIQRFSEEPRQYTLAVSLHSAVQATRNALMPGMKKTPLTKLRSSLQKYALHTNRRFTFEYAVFPSINDTEAEVEALIRFCSGLLCHVNLLEPNPHGSFACPAPNIDRLKSLEARLVDANIPVSLRASKGRDIRAACGQLSQAHDGPPIISVQDPGN